MEYLWGDKHKKLYLNFHQLSLSLTRKLRKCSRVSAEKFISTIFVSRFTNAKFIVIIVFNSTIEGSAKAIRYKILTEIAFCVYPSRRSPKI
jgi:hypothetical protein